MATNPNDIIRDVQIEAQTYLTRLDYAADRAYSAALQDLEDDIAARIASMERGSKRKRLQQIKLQINNELNNIYSEYQTDLESDKESAAGISYKSTNKAWNDATEAKGIGWTKVPFGAIQAMVSVQNNIRLNPDGEPRVFNVVKEINKLKPEHKRNFYSSVRRAVAEGLGAEATVRDFRERAGTVNGVKMNQIRALTRTSINDAMNKASKYSEETNFKDRISGYQWITVFDMKTSKICASQAGKVRKTRDGFEYGEPPLHHNCRSKIVALSKLSDTSTFENLARVQDHTIGTSYGEIKSKWDVDQKTGGYDKMIKVNNPAAASKYSAYDKWFGTLDQKRQVQILGPQMYKVYSKSRAQDRENPIPIKDMIRGDGSIKTVREVARKIGIDSEGIKEIRKRDIKAYQPKITRRAAKILREREAARKQN